MSHLSCSCSIYRYLDTSNSVEPIPVKVDIVIADVPPLLGLNVLDREHLPPNVSFNVLAKRQRADDGDGKPLYV